MEPLTLQGKNIVIIGGTTGMGFSAALTFVHAGAHVVVTGKDAGTTAPASDRLGDGGIAIHSDATEAGSAEDAITRCHDLYGHVDGLYHVAGGSGRKMGDGPLHEMTLEAWNHTLALNLTSMMLSNQAAIRYFLDQGRGGTILNMGSVLGFSPSPRYFSTHAYATAKAAVVGFSKSIAAYYASRNIRVNVIAPGLIETPMAERAAKDAEIMQFIRNKQPLDGGRIGRPADIDGLALYFMSDSSRFTTGQVVAVDGGWSVSEGQYQGSKE
jgi:NAD(P)-dependent dehydrogenase (short-subunit alcohol dehydrogenase family)